MSGLRPKRVRSAHDHHVPIRERARGELAQQPRLACAGFPHDAHAEHPVFYVAAPVVQERQIFVAPDQGQGELGNGFRLWPFALDGQPRAALAAELRHGHERAAGVALERRSGNERYRRLV